MKYKKKILIIISILILFNSAFAKDNENTDKKEQKVYTIDEVVIRERKIRVIEEAASTSRITKDDVVAHADVSLDDSLKNVPGMNVSMHKKGHVRASLRGFDQNRVAILMDGIPLNDVYSSDIDISGIPVSNIEKIVVNRGASSALLGTMGEVGVINIITRKPSVPYFEADLRYGQHNNIFLNFSHGAPVGNFYYWISGEAEHKKGYKVSEKLSKSKRKDWFDKIIRYDLYGLTFDQVKLPAVDDYINDTGLKDHTQHTKYSVSGKAGYSIAKDTEAGLFAEYTFKKADTSTFQHNCISNYKSSSGEWTDPGFDASSERSEVLSSAFRNRSFHWPSIHNFRISPYAFFSFKNFSVKTNFFMTYKKANQEKYASTDESWPGDRALADTAYESFLTIKEYLSAGGNINPEVKLCKWNTLKFAFLYKYNIYNEQNQALSAEESPAIAATLFGLEPFTVQRLDSSGFTAAVEDELKFGEYLNISLGISYDAQFLNTFKNREALYQYDDAYIVKTDSKLLGTKDSFNPVFAMIYSPVPDFIVLRLAGSIKTRFPNLSEYSKIVDDKRDNRLKPERTYNLNTGFEILLDRGDFSFRNDYFFNRVKDKIEKITGGIDPPVNIGEVRSHGIESIIKFSREKVTGFIDLDFIFSYTWLLARSIDDTPEEKVNKGDYLEFTPEHQICADLRLKFISKTQVSIWGNSTLNQYVYAMNSRPVPNDDTAGFSTGYFKKVKLHNPIKLNIKISQKFLEHYEMYFICKNILDDYNADPLIPGPGRMFYLGGKIKL